MQRFRATLRFCVAERINYGCSNFEILETKIDYIFYSFFCPCKIIMKLKLTADCNSRNTFSCIASAPCYFSACVIYFCASTVFVTYGLT